MKHFLGSFIFSFLMLPLFLNAQELVSVSTYKTFSSSANLDYMDQPTRADLNLTSTYAPEKDKCKTYKGMKVAGLVLTITGPVVFVGGTVLVVIGAINSEDNGDKYAGLAAVGAIGMVTGALMTGAGIPLLIVGNIKSKKYCGGKSSQLNLNTNKNGIGLAFTF